MEDEVGLEEEYEEGSSRKAPKIIGICVAILLLAGCGYFGWAKFMKGADDNVAAKGTSAGTNSSPIDTTGFGQMFPLDTFVVNLSDPGGKRYLKTKIELEFRSNEMRNELTSWLPQLRDSILILLSSKTLGDIQSIDGKIALRNALIMRINQLLKQGRIKNLYFTEFVVQ